MADPSSNGDPLAEWRKANAEYAQAVRDLDAILEKGRRMNIRWAYIFGLMALFFLIVAILTPFAWYLRVWWTVMAGVEIYMATLALRRAKRHP